MTTGELIQRFIQLRDAVEAKTKAFELELKPYKDGMAAIENAVGQQIIDMGGESIKTEHGTAYRTSVLSVKMADRETFLQFVIDNNALDYLTSAVSKELVKDYIEANNCPPPGLDIAYIHKTNFRRS